MEEPIENLRNLVVPIIGIGIVLVVGFLIFAGAKDVTVQLASSANVTNEQVALNGMNIETALAYSTHAIELSCSEIRNVSNSTGQGDPLAVSNYTCSVQGINVTGNDSVTSGRPNNGTVYVDYTYKNSTLAYRGISSTQNATQEIPGWLPVIIIVIIGGILIALISYFKRN